MRFRTFERTTAAVFECSLAWCTADSCQWDDWRMETNISRLVSVHMGTIL